MRAAGCGLLIYTEFARPAGPERTGSLWGLCPEVPLSWAALAWKEAHGPVEQLFPISPPGGHTQHKAPIVSGGTVAPQDDAGCPPSKGARGSLVSRRRGGAGGQVAAGRCGEPHALGPRGRLVVPARPAAAAAPGGGASPAATARARPPPRAPPRAGHARRGVSPRPPGPRRRGPPWSTSARPRLVARRGRRRARAEDAEPAGGPASLRGAGRGRPASREEAAPSIPRFPGSCSFLPPPLPLRPGLGGGCTPTSGRGGCSVDTGGGGAGGAGGNPACLLSSEAADLLINAPFGNLTVLLLSFLFFNFLLAALSSRKRQEPPNGRCRASA